MCRWCSDLSYNQISQVSRGIPASVTFLNLSHNTLQSNWIQTPLPMTTLDVSYNQGGLHWIQNVKWGESLTKLTRLIYRGNNLRNLKWGYDNFPAGQHPFSAVDLIGNPQLVLRIERDTYDPIVQKFTLSADATSYNETLLLCENRTKYVVQLESLPVQYSPQGDAEYTKALAPTGVVYVCSWGYGDPRPTTLKPGFDDTRPFNAALLIVVVIAILLVKMYLLFRCVRCCCAKVQRSKTPLLNQDDIPTESNA
ncbi:hypothetical protein AC1031_011261 [Aphanomyces cochlioides]|nr:hypothetical protein AC1031_011261 [Aphanomyces cochlioides]